jgi:hypothetical protein
MTRRRCTPATLKFLLAARQSELDGLEALASMSALVGHVSRLVHALQKERGYSNMFLSGAEHEMPARLAELRGEAEEIETRARRFLLNLNPQELRSADAARLLHCIACALYRLDESPDLRWQVRERKLGAQEACARYTRLIASLLAVVFEAADSALDPDVTRTLVALFNFMQGKESAGQERALGVMGYQAGRLPAAQKTRMLDLAENQLRSFDTFSHYAPPDAALAWQGIQQTSEPLLRLRQALLEASPGQAADRSLAGLWYDICTARIDAMRDIERQLTDALESQCRSRIAAAREELENHQLLLSRFADAADDGAPALLFNIQQRRLEEPLRDGLGREMERSLLDILHAQTLRMQQTGDELSRARVALAERRLAEKAKWMLVERYGLTEQAAHERLLRLSMQSGLSLEELARQLLAQPLGQG